MTYIKPTVKLTAKIDEITFVAIRIMAAFGERAIMSVYLYYSLAATTRLCPVLASAKSSYTKQIIFNSI